jgi:hypothetical protein
MLGLIMKIAAVLIILLILTGASAQDSEFLKP